MTKTYYVAHSDDTLKAIKQDIILLNTTSHNTSTQKELDNIIVDLKKWTDHVFSPTLATSSSSREWVNCMLPEGINDYFPLLPFIPYKYPLPQELPYALLGYCAPEDDDLSISVAWFE